MLRISQGRNEICNAYSFDPTEFSAELSDFGPKTKTKLNFRSISGFPITTLNFNPECLLKLYFSDKHLRKNSAKTRK